MLRWLSKVRNQEIFCYFLAKKNAFVSDSLTTSSDLRKKLV